jgi:hypothetical protein
VFLKLKTFMNDFHYESLKGILGNVMAVMKELPDDFQQWQRR